MRQYYVCAAVVQLLRWPLFSMRLLDLTLPTPAENLALDEALLEAAEAGTGGETLRFWESPAPFVVLGYSNRFDTEVNVTACEANSVPILRRASGGGTVVQGPGCLNYALVLNCERPGLHSIPGANRAIMQANRAAVQSLLLGKVAIQGHTDLTLEGRKFSGNAQRRKRAFLLFHGTFLLNFDLPLISRLLRLPTQQPAYRQGRAHAEFIGNTGLAAAAVKSALAAAWGAREILADAPRAEAARLVAEKYSRDDWNRRY
jgi:lipoate-protein ligase A